MRPLLHWNGNKYYVFFVLVALCIQHAVRMRRIILSSVACLAKPHFSTLSQNGTIFLGRGEGGVTEHVMRVLILSVAFV